MKCRSFEKLTYINFILYLKNSEKNSERYLIRSGYMEIFVFTDGSNLGNPGPGGYAALLCFSDTKKEIVVKGGEMHTTNNRMEISAVIEAFKKIISLKKAPKKISVFSDSTLVIKTMTHGWKKKENLDLWQKLYLLIDMLQKKHTAFSWHWVKGHASHPENEKCDRLAVAEAKKFQKKAPKSAASSTALPSESYALPFFCKLCGKAVNGKLSRKANLIRVDCEHCGKFIKFAPHTKANLTRAKDTEMTLF